MAVRDKHVIVNTRNTDSDQGHGDCRQLFDACTPLVYAHNAFRITGLAVDASVRDVKRRIDDLKAAEEIGGADEEHSHAFALDPPPSMEHIREAAQRLQDPERRIVEEFFWFWPESWGNGKADSALVALRGGDKDTAFNIWSHALRSTQQSQIVAKHNMAVMYHLVALDSEQSFLESEPPPMPEHLKKVDEYWHTCFKWWEELTEHEPFWSLFADRIRMLDDPRLTTGFTRRVRSTFPKAFDRINAMLAMKYAEKQKFEMARKHIAYMNETHQGLDDVDSTVSLIVKPLEARVSAAVEKALTAGRKDAHSAAKFAQELIDTTSEPLSIIRHLLDDGHSIRSYLFEQVTDACFTCLIAYGNDTEDWPTCISLLKKTETIAITEEAREKIRANIAVAANNHKQKQLYKHCWFCKKNKATESGRLDQPMHGDVTRTPTSTGTHVQWRHITVTVPRCDECSRLQGGGGTVGTAVNAGIGVGRVLGPLGATVGLAAGLLVGGGRHLYRALRLPPGVLPESAKSTFPAIKEILDKGWQFGEKPSS